MNTNNISSVIQKHLVLLDELKLFNNQVNVKTLLDSADSFITDNRNFFTKSFTITLCAYLESYLKDIAMEIVDEMNKRLSNTKVPHNLVKWSILKKKELSDMAGSEMKFEYLNIYITKKELDQFISGNTDKTINLFKKMGLDLTENDDFMTMIQKISTIVEKRNKIVHHNDSASDITFADVKDNIDFVKAYIKVIDESIMDFLKA